jgi:hypothetical protein
MTGIMTAISGSIPGIIYANGLYRRTYSGYFNDDVNYFDSASPTAAAVDTSPLGPGTPPSNTSYQWLGYWRATSDTIFNDGISLSTYFQLTSDDASYMWIGNTAITGYTTGNALINNGGVHTSTTVSGNTPMTAGVYYPIRIQYGNNTGSTAFSLTVYTISLGTYTTTMTSNIFYNSVTQGL